MCASRCQTDLVRSAWSEAVVVGDAEDAPRRRVRLLLLRAAAVDLAHGAHELAQGVVAERGVARWLLDPAEPRAHVLNAIIAALALAHECARVSRCRCRRGIAIARVQSNPRLVNVPRAAREEVVLHPPRAVAPVVPQLRRVSSSSPSGRESSPTGSSGAGVAARGARAGSGVAQADRDTASTSVRTLVMRTPARWSGPVDPVTRAPGGPIASAADPPPAFAAQKPSKFRHLGAGRSWHRSC